MYKLLFILILLVDIYLSASQIYYKDITEQCRRKVVPSMFLATRTVKANSRTLHLSRLELPYNCYISLRTEAGHHIILVIHVADEAKVSEACKHGNQMTVHEIGETHGGYWGPLPQFVLEEENHDNHEQESWPTTRPPEPSESESSDTERETEGGDKHTTSSDNDDEKKYISVDVPIVNITVMDHPSMIKENQEEDFEDDQLFDMFYDVMPKPGTKYMSTMVPIVQFSLEPIGRRAGEDRFNLHYQIGGFTLDNMTNSKALATNYKYNWDANRNNNFKSAKTKLFQAITSPRMRTQTNSKALATNYKYNWDANRNNNFKSAKTKLFQAITSPRMRTQTKEFTNRHRITPYTKTTVTKSIQTGTKNTKTLTETTRTQIKTIKDLSWEQIDDILKGLRKTTTTESGFDFSKSKLLENIADMDYSISVYLSPSLTLHNNKKQVNKYLDPKLTPKIHFSTFTKRPFSSVKNNFYSFDEIAAITTASENSYKNDNGVALSVATATNFTALHKLDSIKADFQLKSRRKQSEIYTNKIKNDIKTLSMEAITKRLSNTEIDPPDLGKTTKRMTMTKFDTASGDRRKFSMGDEISNIGESTESGFLVASGKETTRTGALTFEGGKLIEGSMTNERNSKEGVSESTKPTDWGVLAHQKTEFEYFKLRTGSLLDHESWENLVRAAPVMAVLLNKTSSPISTTMSTEDSIDSGSITTQPMKERKRRKKRSIHSININDEVPNQLPTTTETLDLSENVDLADLQMLPTLLELQDDEMTGRVALRYMRNYIGKSIYTLCQETADNRFFILLVNSSRMVISINNFTMDGLTIVATSAHTLMRPEAICPEATLECQINGSRVCIDNNSACDDVPNCGAEGIYDEDRNMCGKSEGLEHGVTTAAGAFLVALLTLIFTVHYWLKRCVQKVADAFFVYQNGTENILYLHTIMRSPNDTDIDDASKLVQGAPYLDIEYDFYTTPIKKKQNPLRRIINALRRAFIGKRIEKDLSQVEEYDLRNLRYSFAQGELLKMFKTDASIQTGPSLEMGYLEDSVRVRHDNNISKINQTESKIDSLEQIEGKGQRRLTKGPQSFEADLEKGRIRAKINELNILKFFKESKSDSIQLPEEPQNRRVSFSQKNSSTMAERELLVTNYERSIDTIESYIKDSPQATEKAGPSGTFTKSMKLESLDTITRDKEISLQVEGKATTSQTLKKSLRFEEETVIIPSLEEIQKMKKSGTSLTPKRSPTKSGESPRTSEGRSFFGVKGKSPKKKPQKKFR